MGHNESRVTPNPERTGMWDLSLVFARKKKKKRNRTMLYNEIQIGTTLKNFFPSTGPQFLFL